MLKRNMDKILPNLVLFFSMKILIIKLKVNLCELKSVQLKKISEVNTVRILAPFASTINKL